MLERTHRRRFLQQVAAAGGLGVWTAASRSRVYGAGERLRVASVGVSNKGWSDVTSVAESPHVEIVALCDVDEGPTIMGRAAERFPHARRYTDWRRLLDQAREFDAVIVSTPDHMHAPVSLAAMQLGKHVHCQKPLSHTVFEARQMSLAARRANVVTQMGNQIQSHAFYRTAVKLVHDGAIGKVGEVHSWQSGPMRWMLVDERPPGSDPVPATLHWDNWLGVAPERPFKQRIYHPKNWRAWQDFSNGQLGDFACHILDPVFLALKLTAPTSIRAEAPPLPRELWTKRALVQYEFPATELTTSQPLKVTWYDGEGHYPPRDGLGLPASLTLPGAGSVLVGEKGSLLLPHVGKPRLFADGKESDRKIELLEHRNHYTSWAHACRGEDKTTSPFSYAGPLSETVLLGTVAIRLNGQTLRWDSPGLRFTEPTAANDLLRKPYRKGWEPAWVS